VNLLGLNLVLTLWVMRANIKFYNVGVPIITNIILHLNEQFVIKLKHYFIRRYTIIDYIRLYAISGHIHPPL